MSSVVLSSSSVAIDWSTSNGPTSNGAIPSLLTTPSVSNLSEHLSTIHEGKDENDAEPLESKDRITFLRASTLSLGTQPSINSLSVLPITAHYSGGSVTLHEFTGSTHEFTVSTGNHQLSVQKQDCLDRLINAMTMTPNISQMQRRKLRRICGGCCAIGIICVVVFAIIAMKSFEVF